MVALDFLPKHHMLVSDAWVILGSGTVTLGQELNGGVLSAHRGLE